MIVLPPNLVPPGTRPGSMIDVVAVHTDEGHNTLSCAIPIPEVARPDDVMVVWFASGGNGTTRWQNGHQQPEGFFAWHGEYTGVQGIAAQVTVALLTHRVKKGEPGTSVYWSWDFAALDSSWELVAATCRYVNAEAPINAYGQPRSDADGSRVGAINVGRSGSLVLAAMAFAASSGTVWVAPNTYGALSSDEQGKGGQSTQSPDAWFGMDGKPGNIGGAYGLVPNLGLVAGVVDVGVPYDLGGGTGWWSFLAWVTQNQPSGTTATGTGVGWSVSLSPLPQPSPVLFSLEGLVGGYLDVETTPPSASWDYRQYAGLGPQVGWWAAREHPDGSGVGFWNADLNVWEAEFYANYGDVATYVWPTGAWHNDGSDWLFYGGIIEGAANQLSQLPAALSFRAQALPLVTVVQPGGNVPASPSVSWVVNTAGYAFRVRIASSDQYLDPDFDPDTSRVRSESGTVASSATVWTPSSPLRGGGYYRAYVSVQGVQGGPWSKWSSIDFFASYDALATPSVVAVAGLDPVTSCPRAEITVTAHDASDWTGTTYLNLYRYDPEAQAMVPVRFAQDVPIPWPSQRVVLFDYQMPPNSPATYQAEVYSTKPAPVFTLDDPVLGTLDTAGHPLS